MKTLEAKTLEPDSSPILWMIVALLAYGILYFSNGLVFERMPVADGANELVIFSYQFSGLSRGEYPLWNPLNRTGEPLYLMNTLFMANPISNIIIIIFILLGITNISLAFLVFNFTLTTLYIIAIYLIILNLTRNHHSATFGGILGLGSGMVAMNLYASTGILLMYSVPWICYGFLKYFQTFQFKFLLVFILALVSSIHSWEVAYTLIFLFLALISGIFFYRKLFIFDRLSKIPRTHLWFFICAVLFFCTPMVLIILKIFNGNLLPPGTRFDTTQTAIKETMSLNSNLTFQRLSKFFFTCENCLTAMFTGAFWGKFIVGRYYIGPLLFPFLTVALFARIKTVYCISLLIILLSMLAGEIFPFNFIYQLPFINLIKYGVIFNSSYIVMLVIILAGLTYSTFMNYSYSIKKKYFIRSGLLVMSGCALLAFSLPRTAISDAGLLISSLASLILIILIYFFRNSSINKLSHAIIILALLTATIYNYNLLNIYPMLKGVNYKNSELSNLTNRQDHSLKFSMERPDSLLVSSNDPPFIVTPGGTQGPYTGQPGNITGPSALSDEYFSFITLSENTYHPPLERSGIAAFPFQKNYFNFRSLPESDLLLRKKFFFFDKVFISKSSDYLSRFMERPGLLRMLIENNIGIVDKLDDHLHPSYRGQFDSEKITFLKDTPSANISNINVKEFSANRIKLNLTTNKPGLLLYTDIWEDGWRAKINGETTPVLKVFHTYKGIQLTGGVHEVEFYFTNHIMYALIIFNASYFILLAYIIFRFMFEGLIRNKAHHK